MRDHPLDPREVLGLSPEELPRHIAIIMDGNGRWANARGRPRIRGHEEGAKTVRRVVTQCARLGIEVLTLYSFSAENWKRPRLEVEFLMELCKRYLVKERREIMDNNIKLRHVGRREGLPEKVLRELDKTAELSAENSGLTLCLAINYGARLEIVEAVRKIAAQVRDGKQQPEEINDDTVAGALYTRGLPDPDLLIRTAGEQRISNFLLWQISYAELHITETLWPDFSIDHLHAAIQDFARRDRRFGALAATSDSSMPDDDG
jgi:undecaprenyl diphosphate synthase